MKVKRDTKTAFTTVSIPTQLFKKVENHIKGTGFPSVSNYIAFLLRSVLSEKNADSKAKANYEANLIKDRLKELGYIE